LDTLNDSKDGCVADVGSYTDQHNGIKDLKTPEQQDMFVAPNVLGMIWPTQKPNGVAQKLSVMVNARQIRRNGGIKKK
jgi:hypothetical protein